MLRFCRVLLVGVLCLGMFGGCATYRDTIIDIAQEDTKNAEAMRIASRQLLRTWGINAGAIDVGIRYMVNPSLIPSGVRLAIDELNTLARMTDEELDSLSQFDRDYVLSAATALRIVLGLQIMRQVLEMFAPEVMKQAAIFLM